MGDHAFQIDPAHGHLVNSILKDFYFIGLVVVYVVKGMRESRFLPLEKVRIQPVVPFNPLGIDKQAGDTSAFTQ